MRHCCGIDKTTSTFSQHCANIIIHINSLRIFNTHLSQHEPTNVPFIYHCDDFNLERAPSSVFFKTTHRDHFSNDDLTINSPIFFDLLSIDEEAQFEETLEAEESVTQEEIEFESIDIADEAIIEADDVANDSIEVLPEIDAPNV
jgi:hypothetical protein